MVTTKADSALVQCRCQMWLRKISWSIVSLFLMSENATHVCVPSCFKGRCLHDGPSHSQQKNDSGKRYYLSGYVISANLGSATGMSGEYLAGDSALPLPNSLSFIGKSFMVICASQYFWFYNSALFGIAVRSSSSYLFPTNMFWGPWQVKNRKLSRQY